MKFKIIFLGVLSVVAFGCAAAHYDGASAHSLGVGKAAVCINEGETEGTPSVLTETSDEQSVGATEKAEETAKTTSVKERTSSSCAGTLVHAESRGFTGWDSIDAALSAVVAWLTFGTLTF